VKNHILQNKPCSVLFLTSVHILQVSGIMLPSPLSIIFLADSFISDKIFSLKICGLPRFFDRYWHTAAGVIPSFSAVSFHNH